MLLKLEKLCFLLCLRPSLRICMRARGRASRTASPAAPRARLRSAQHAAPHVPGRSRPVSRALGPWPNSAAHPAHGLLWPPGGLLCSTRSAPSIRIGRCSASFAWNKLHPATGSSNPSIVPLLSRLDCRRHRRRPRAAAPWPRASLVLLFLLSLCLLTAAARRQAEERWPLATAESLNSAWLARSRLWVPEGMVAPVWLLAGMRARPRGSTPLSSGLARAPFDPSVGDSVAAAARFVFRVWVARSSAPAPLFVFPARRRATAGGGDRRRKYHLDPAGPFL